MGVALDGSGHSVNNNVGTNQFAVTLTTAIAGDVIVLVATTNSAHVSSVASANTTGWALRKRQGDGAGNFIETWYGLAAAALTAEVITATYVPGSGFNIIDVLGVSGADTSTVWDANAALPDGQTTADCHVTTSNAADFLLGCYRFASTTNPTEGAGWTKVSGADFQLVEYKIVAATQTALDVGIGTGNTDENAGIGDAIMAASVADVLMAQACL